MDVGEQTPDGPEMDKEVWQPTEAQEKEIKRLATEIQWVCELLSKLYERKDFVVYLNEDLFPS